MKAGTENITAETAESGRTADGSARMEYTRRHVRYPIRRAAYYCLPETWADKKKCTIINISRKGMGILFHSADGIPIGVPIRVEIPLPHALESISVNGSVKWVNKSESDYVGGIELHHELSDVKFSKLC